MVLTQGISKPYLPKRGEDKAGKLGKREKGDRKHMLEAGLGGDWEGCQVCREYWNKWLEEDLGF